MRGGYDVMMVSGCMGVEGSEMDQLDQLDQGMGVTPFIQSSLRKSRHVSRGSKDHNRPMVPCLGYIDYWSRLSSFSSIIKRCNMLGHRTLRSFRPGTERYTSLQQDDGSDPDVAEAAGQHSSDHFPSASTDRCSPTGSPSSEDSVSDQLAITPLPYATIMALCAGRFAEGLMFGVILPYINEMVHGMGVRQEDLGKWSAAAVSAISTGPPVDWVSRGTGDSSTLTFERCGEMASSDYIGSSHVCLWSHLCTFHCISRRQIWAEMGVPDRSGAVGRGVHHLRDPRDAPGCHYISLAGYVGSLPYESTVAIADISVGIIAGPSLMSRTIMGEITDKTNAVQGKSNNILEFSRRRPL